jgi:hypothetical protein
MNQPHMPPRTIDSLHHVLEEAVFWRDHWKAKYKSEVPSLKEEIRQLRKQLKEKCSGE